MTPEEELIKVKANFDRYLADLEAVAKDLPVPMPEPGTDMAKLLTANVLLRRRVEVLKADRDQGAKDYCELRDRDDELFTRFKTYEFALEKIANPPLGLGIRKTIDYLRGIASAALKQ